MFVSGLLLLVAIVWGFVLIIKKKETKKPFIATSVMALIYMLSVGFVAVEEEERAKELEERNSAETTAVEEDTETEEPTKEEATEASVEEEEVVAAATEPEPEPEEAEVKLEEVTLGTGTFIVGEDIQPGRYVVSTQESSGNFFIDGGLNYTNEILGTDTSFAVNNLTVSIEEGQNIKISGLNAVLFKPKQ